MIRIRVLPNCPTGIKLFSTSEYVHVDSAADFITLENEKNNRQSFAVTNDILLPIVKTLWSREEPLFRIISIETRSRCNMHCSFCPVNSEHDPRILGYMPMSTIQKICYELQQLNYSDTILLFGNNEPLLDERIVDITTCFRIACPHAFIKILTNGIMLTTALATALFEAGLSTLVVNNYTDGVKVIEPVKELLSAAKYFESYDVRISMRKIDEVLTTRAGQAPNKERIVQPLKQFCALPFVDMNVSFTGKVILCCFDAIGKTDLGDVNTSSIVDIWRGATFAESRIALLQKDRSRCELCSGCDYDGFRDPYQRRLGIEKELGFQARKWINNMYQDKIVEKTVAYVKSEMAKDSSGHDWWHVYRVWKTALHLAQCEKADSFVVQLAALLHDIRDYKFHDGDETLGPKTARIWLEQAGVNEDTIVQVSDIISSMHFRGAREKSAIITLEGMIVQDADRLDAIGAIGVSRAFAFGGYKGHKMHEPSEEPVMHASFAEYKKRESTVINHFREKLLLLRDLMNTNSAKEIATRRDAFMREFLDEFLKEWDSGDILEA